MSRYKIAGVLVGLAGLVTVVACGGGTSSSSSSGALAASQILKFPVFQDPTTWDPAEASHEVDSELMQNAFDNLWRYDDKINLVPDIATAVPTTGNGGISADGMTYTVHLQHNVTFNNGDKVTSKDVLYSWNRSAALRGPYSSNLAAVAGFNAVQKAGKAYCAHGADPTSCHTQVEQHLAANDTTLQMSGLTAPDAFTVQIVLTSPCGWCVYAWSLQSTTGAIVDQNVIKNDPLSWWSKPGGPGVTDGQVGTGAYYLSSYIPKQSIQYKQVPNWWGSSDGQAKPTLTEIDMDIKDPSTQSTDIAAWEQGSYDIVGYGGNSTQPTADILRIKANSSENSQLLLIPKGRTTWVSPAIGNPGAGGPFQGESATAKGLRMAFDLAIDRNALVSTVCHNILCAAATGGLITKGLVGYLGDGKDPLAKFDATTAKTLLHQFDPTGSLTANIKYSYNAGGLNDPVSSFLQAQWQQNLGVSVALDPHPDANAFIGDRLAGKYVMSRDGWQFDYNHPQDWFDNLWGNGPGAGPGNNTSGYGNQPGDPQPNYDSVLAMADGLPIAQALPLYNQLAQQLATDVAYFPLYYSVGQFLIHSYVKGAGSNAQADFNWNEISILQH